MPYLSVTVLLTMKPMAFRPDAMPKFFAPTVARSLTGWLSAVVSRAPACWLRSSSAPRSAYSRRLSVRIIIRSGGSPAANRVASLSRYGPLSWYSVLTVMVGFFCWKMSSAAWVFAARAASPHQDMFSWTTPPAGSSSPPPKPRPQAARLSPRPDSPATRIKSRRLNATPAAEVDLSVIGVASPSQSAGESTADANEISAYMIQALAAGTSPPAGSTAATVPPMPARTALSRQAR
jgi:hypothetical protein